MEKRVKKDAATNKKNFLRREGFNENGTTFVYILPNSYDIKEELKECGCRFNSVLRWHCAEIPANYDPASFVEVAAADLLTFTAWGSGTYNENAKELIDSLMVIETVESNSEYFGEEKEKFSDLPVVLKKIRVVENMYGFTQMVRFETEDENVLIWWTKVDIPYEIGDTLYLSGTIKSHTEYRNEKQTTITRCKMHD